MSVVATQSHGRRVTVSKHDHKAWKGSGYLRKYLDDGFAEMMPHDQGQRIVHLDGGEFFYETCCETISCPRPVIYADKEVWETFCDLKREEVKA